MLRSECKVGMKVYFGRERGEKTFGIVVKTNPSNAKVQILESRGYGRGGEVGTGWTVPYSLITLAGDDAAASKGSTLPVIAEKVANFKPEPLKFNPFDMAAEKYIMQAIAGIYNELSPENLTCDGELPAYRVKEKRQRLQRMLDGCFHALGKVISEEDACTWEASCREWRSKNLLEKS